MRAAAAVLALAILISGCMTPVAPMRPTSSGPAWTSWDGPFVEMGRTYGFIGADADGYGPPGMRYVALDRGGHVLVVDYQYKIEGDDPWSLSFRDSRREPWRALLEPLLRGGDMYRGPDGEDGLRSGPVRIVDLKARTLSADEREGVLAALDDAFVRAKDHELHGMGIADCGYVTVRTHGQRVALNCGEGDQGWKDAVQQMQFLADWLLPGE